MSLEDKNKGKLDSEEMGEGNIDWEEDLEEGTEIKDPPKNSDSLEKEVPKGLNVRQEMFCQLFAGDKEFYGNGVQSYIAVYNPDQSKTNWYKSACQSSSRLLSNIKVCKRISELLEEGGLNDSAVDKQLSFVIIQNVDLKSKVAGIREYNRLKQRVINKNELALIETSPEMLQKYLDDLKNKEKKKDEPKPEERSDIASGK